MQHARILIIEDDPSSRDGLADFLTEEGYTVMTACDGAEGVAVQPTFQPDLVLTDLQMPRLTGWQVVAHLQQTAPTLPVIILTASVEIDARREAQRLGVHDYLNKPLDLDEVLRRVQRALSQ